MVEFPGGHPPQPLKALRIEAILDCLIPAGSERSLADDKSTRFEVDKCGRASPQRNSRRHPRIADRPEEALPGKLAERRGPDLVWRLRVGNTVAVEVI